jgi:hypothetical protein
MFQAIEEAVSSTENTISCRKMKTTVLLALLLK